MYQPILEWLYGNIYNCRMTSFYVRVANLNKCYNRVLDEPSECVNIKRAFNPVHTFIMAFCTGSVASCVFLVT